MRMKISVLCLLVFVSYAFYGVFSAISITSFPPGCVGLWSCSNESPSGPGCTESGGSVTVTSFNTAGTTPCNAVNNVFPTSCVDEIAVFSEQTDQFYFVSCLDSNGNPVAKVKCTETCVINFGATAGFCASPGSNSDYLRTDNEVVTYDCSGTTSQCEFTSYPGTVVQYYFDVTGSGDFGGTEGAVSTSATTPDCVCENTGVSPSGSPTPTCTSFSQTTVDITIDVPEIPLDNTHWCFAGTAHDQGSDLQIVVSGGQDGAAYIINPYNIGAHGFTLQATVQVSDTITNPGDGFAFIVQQDPAACNALALSSGGGETIGYAGIENAFVVEFDAYQNSDNNDPDDHHIGVQASPSVGAPVDAVHGSTSTVISPISVNPYIDVSDGTITHSIFVQYQASSTLLTVIYDGENLIYNRNIGNAISQLLLNGAQVGFTAATGASSDSVLITNVQFSSP